MRDPVSPDTLCFSTALAQTEADAAFTAEVYQAALMVGVECPQLAADSNQANPDADSVGDYLDELERIDPGAFEALAYLEQPTRADIAANPFDWTVRAEERRSRSVRHESSRCGIGVGSAIISGLALHNSLSAAVVFRPSPGRTPISQGSCWGNP